MAATGSAKFGQIRIHKPTTFANMGESTHGVPNTIIPIGDSMRDQARGLACANPELSSTVNTAENEQVRAQAYRSPLTMLTRAPEATLELYGRGEGRTTGYYDDPIFEVIDTVLSTSEDIPDLVPVLSWVFPADPDAEYITEVVVSEAQADAALTVGCGIYVKIAPEIAYAEADKLYTAFIKDIGVAVLGEVTVTLGSGIPVALFNQLSDDPNDPGNPAGLNGGRTYVQGNDMPDLYIQMVKKSYLKEAYGMIGASMEFDFTTGETVKQAVTMRGVWVDQHGYIPDTIDVQDGGWAENTVLTQVAREDLLPGDLFEASGNGLLFVREVVSVDNDTDPGRSIVTFTPPIQAFHAVTLNSVPPVPMSQHGPDATPEPAGTWLAFLGGYFIGDTGTLNVKSVKFNVDNAPTIDTNPNNQAGAACWVPGDQIVTGELVLSGYDNARHWRRFLASGTFELLVTAQAGELGEVITVYMPSVHIIDPPDPASDDDLVTLPIKFEARIYTGDSVASRPGLVSNSPFRYFVGR